MTTPTKEVRVRVPADFIGETTKTKKFIQECELYIRVNRHIYDDDEKKVVFALSFMIGGTATAWKEAFTAKAITDNDFGTWAKFKTDLTEAFSPVDDAGTARTQIKNLKQSSCDNLEDYISKFRILRDRTGITEDTALIEYFMDGLNSKILEKVFNMENVPTTLTAWFTAAAKYDGQWRRAKAIIGKVKETIPKHEKPITPHFVPTRDPNAMDIDRLTATERTRHMKEGRCFTCHQVGHRASDHKAGGPPPRNNQSRFVPQKRTGADAHRKIATLLAELDDEEKNIALTKMEEEGF
jgi:hypothetical protein